MWVWCKTLHTRIMHAHTKLVQVTAANCIVMCQFRLLCVLFVLQTNLTWLDLSFNQLSAIEGLEQLIKLQDLSLFNNQISSLQGLDTLQNLNVLSIGEQLRLGEACLLHSMQLVLHPTPAQLCQHGHLATGAAVDILEVATLWLPCP